MPRRAAEQLGEQRRRREHLLEVVEHEQRPPVAQVRDERLRARLRPGRLAQAERVGDRRRHELGVADRRELDQHDAVRDSSPRPSVASTASRVFPDPAGPVSVRRRTSSSPEQLADLAQLAPAADERGRSRGRRLGGGRPAAASGDGRGERRAPDPGRGSRARGCRSAAPARSRASRRASPAPPGRPRAPRPACPSGRARASAGRAGAPRAGARRRGARARRRGRRPGRERDPRRCDPGARRGAARRAGRSRPAPTARRRSRRAAARARARAPPASCRPATGRLRSPVLRPRAARSGAGRDRPARRRARSPQAG